MTESKVNGALERDLEKVFRIHEHRIEDALHKMSQSFERCTQSPDIALMSNFFDYLNYRLVATCKKIEVDYFAKKAERPIDTADARRNGKSCDQMATGFSDKETIDSVDATELTKDLSKNGLNNKKLDDIQEEDEEETERDEIKKEEETEGKKEVDLHAELEIEQLKIVEDYDSNSIPDVEVSCGSLDTSCDSFETGLSKVDVASDSEQSHNKSSSSSNFSMDSIYGIDSELYFQEETENLGKKRPNSADHNSEANAMKKHKSDDDSMNVDDLEDGEIVELDESKNTNRHMYPSNPLYRFKCMLCENLETNLIDHLKENHAEKEIYVARPSPAMARKIRQRSENFTYTPSSGQITGLCFFCKQTRQFSLSDWKDHLLYHTGEHSGYTSESLSPHGSASFGDDQTELMAFMCKACNYTQVDQNRMESHLLHEHGMGGDDIGNGFDEIVLVPDLKPLEPIKVKSIDYVEESSRFKCGIGWCEEHSNEYTDFKFHLRQEHNYSSQNESFGCLHCSEVIEPSGKSFVRRITEHIKLHGKHLFWCIVCKMPFPSERNCIEHIMYEHPEKAIRFRHQYQDGRAKSDAIEEFIVMLQCNTCNGPFYTFEKASKHFKMRHNSLTIDFMASKLIKRTATDGSVTSLILNHYPLTLRQYFECSLCQETRFNETSLIKHFTKSHRTRPLLLEPGKLFMKYTDESDNDSVVGLTSIRTVFYCYICYQSGGQFMGFVNSQEVFGHWFSTHLEPFRVAKADIGKCFHCNLMGTYHGLKEHHIERHQMKSFAMVDVINSDKCALCEHTSQNVNSHFEQEHHSINSNAILCPIPINDTTLKELIEMKGQKKRRCDHCRAVFETRTEFKMHHGVSHPSIIGKADKFYDNESLHLIAGCCQAKINANELFAHIIDHKFPIKCTFCSFETSDSMELNTHSINNHGEDNDVEQMHFQTLDEFYWKTLIIFGNGLVLNKRNLVGTVHDDSQKFKDFVKKKLSTETNTVLRKLQ